jgi:hypothetical protein
VTDSKRTITKTTLRKVVRLSIKAVLLIYSTAAVVSLLFIQHYYSFTSKKSVVVALKTTNFGKDYALNLDWNIKVSF